MSFIATFLDVSAPPEQADVLKQAFVTLTEAGSEIHSTRTEALLEANTLGSAYDYVLAIRNILQDEASRLLKESGILLNEEATPDLEVWINIIDTIIKVPYLDQPEEILNILNNDELDNTETLLEICSLTTAVNTSMYLYQIQEVSARLLNALDDIVRAKVNSVEQPNKEDIVVERIRKVKPLIISLFEKDTDGMMDSLALDYLDTAVPGYDFNSALNLLYRELQELPREVMILELFTLLLGSSVKDVHTSLDKVLGHLLDDEDIVASIGLINKLTDTLK